MYRQPAAVALTAKDAIDALCRAFSDGYAIEPARLVAALKQAIVPPSENSRNHIVRLFRMLLDLGLRPNDLMAAIAALRAAGGPSSVPHRQTNPFGHEIVDSDVEPSKRLSRQDGNVKFTTFVEHHFPYAKLGGIRKDPAPPIGTATNLLTEQEFECAVVVKPSVFAQHHGVEDPYGEGYPDLLCALAHHVRVSQQCGAMGSVSASVVELGQYESLELHPLTRRWLERAERETQGDFLALPVQTGKRWRGSSMERTAWHCQYADFRIGLFWREVPLPAYVALFELWFDAGLVYGSETSLAIDCPGDVVRLKSDPRPHGLSLVHGRGNVHLIPRDRHAPDAKFASATGLTR